mmetsp:Transcript_2351/g.5014  ORF Transcript_2351/g.5014 Transcript_2351/m.5014 type:complete len:234 (-) Transcript_2351:452-1153(-)
MHSARERTGARRRSWSGGSGHPPSSKTDRNSRPGPSILLRRPTPRETRQNSNVGARSRHATARRRRPHENDGGASRPVPFRRCGRTPRRPSLPSTAPAASETTGAGRRRHVGVPSTKKRRGGSLRRRRRTQTKTSSGTIGTRGDDASGTTWALPCRRTPIGGTAAAAKIRRTTRRRGTAAWVCRRGVPLYRRTRQRAPLHSIMNKGSGLPPTTSATVSACFPVPPYTTVCIDN